MKHPEDQPSQIGARSGWCEEDIKKRQHTEEVVIDVGQTIKHFVPFSKRIKRCPVPVTTAAIVAVDRNN